MVRAAPPRRGPGGPSEAKQWAYDLRELAQSVRRWALCAPEYWGENGVLPCTACRVRNVVRSTYILLLVGVVVVVVASASSCCSSICNNADTYRYQYVLTLQVSTLIVVRLQHWRYLF